MKVRGLVQELRLHEVELKVQNEDLRAAQQEIPALNREYVERYYEHAPCGYLI
jgi:hypothetical protein